MTSVLSLTARDQVLLAQLLSAGYWTVSLRQQNNFAFSDQHSVLVPEPKQVIMYARETLP